MSRIFLSHSSGDWREAVALKQWLVEEDSSLADDIFLDVDPATGIPSGVRWKDALIRASDRCEAVVCLLSANWHKSSWCVSEFRAAELHRKQIFSARLEETVGPDPTDDWQHIDLFGSGPTVAIDIGDGGAPVQFASLGLRRLRDDIWAAGIGAKSFPWPPSEEPDRAPYRGWEPFEPKDAGVFFGRDAQILRATEALRGMRTLRSDALFVVLGPSGTGKSSFLRAGVLPRLYKDDRSYLVLEVVRPERNVLTGESGLAQAIWSTRDRLGLDEPPLGEIRAGCLRSDVAAVGRWLRECQQAAASRLLDVGAGAAAPTLLLPLDQAEELFSADAGKQATQFMRLLRAVLRSDSDSAGGGDSPDGESLHLIVAVTIRTDRYEVMQTAPELAGLGSVVFDDLKPMKPTQFKEVITGPAQRSTKGPRQFRLDGDLADQLLADASEGGDALPLLSLTLARLYENYGSSGRLTLAHYDSQGGMASVVQTEIDGLLSGDPIERAKELRLLRAAFIPWLATVNPVNDQPLRRVSRWTDLPAESLPLIERLVAKRLLVSDRREGHQVVEVALESLLRQWEELAGWLREEREDLKAADNIERNAAAWTASGGDESWLLAGTRLVEAEGLAETAGFRERLTSAQDYLAVSRARADERHEADRLHREAELEAARERQQTAEAHALVLRRRSHVLRVLVAVSVVVALVAVAGLVYAMVARNEAQHRTREAKALQLVQEAQAILDGTKPGTDAQAFHELLAANALTGVTNDGPLLDALLERQRTLKIMSVQGGASGVAFSPDGDRIAASTGDGRILQWSPGDGQAIATPQVLPAESDSDRKPISAISFDTTGAGIVIGRRDGGVAVLDADSGAPLAPQMYGHRGVVVGVAVTGDRIVSAGSDRTVRVWNIRTGRELVEIDTGSPVFGVAVDQAGKVIASAGADGRIRLWDSVTGQSLREFRVPNGGAMSVAISPPGTPGGERLAAGDARGDLRVWNLFDGSVINLSGHADAVMSLAFSPTGDRLASAGADQTVRLWQVSTGESIGNSMTGHDDTVWGVAFSPQGHTLASGGGIDDKTVRLWNADTPQPVSTPMAGHGERVTAAAFSPDGRTIVSGGSDHAIRLWNTNSGRPLAADPVRLRGVVNSVSYGPDGDRVASGSADGTVGVWAVEQAADGRASLSGDAVAVLSTEGSSVLSVAFSPRGDRLAAAAADGSVWVWETGTFDLIRRWPDAHHGVVFTVAFSPDGDLLASGGVDGTVRIWDVDPEAPARPPLGGPPGVITGVAFSPDGTLATAGTKPANDGAHTGVIRLWDVERRAVLTERTVKGLPSSLSFSPDGGRLVTGGFDHDIGLWRIAPDHSRVDRIGDALSGHEDGVASVSFNAAGDYVVSGSADGTLRVWATPPASDLSKLLCHKLTANMDPAEWQRLLPAVDYIATCPDLPVPGG